MATNKKDRIRTKRRKLRTKNSFKGHTQLPRVSVFRSLKHIYAQVIDDSTHKTIASSSTLSQQEQLSGNKKAVAHMIGLALAKKAKEQGVERVMFDRGSYRYHGRVKALAEGLREGGLHI